MADPESYEVYALCYAVRSNRKKHENFIISGWTDPEHDHDPVSYTHLTLPTIYSV